MPSVARIFAVVIKDKMEHNMDNYSEEQSGFWKASSYVDNIFMMKQITEKTSRRTLKYM